MFIVHEIEYNNKLYKASNTESDMNSISSRPLHYGEFEI